MIEKLQPISFEDSRPTATSGWLARYPSGVEFAPLPYETKHPSPIYVWPRKPDVMYTHPLGFEAWFESYVPDADTIRRAIQSLAEMSHLEGAQLHKAVDAFDRAFGPLAYDASYLQVLNGRPGAAPVEVLRTLEDEMMLVWLPLGCYEHEARMLRQTLELHQSIQDAKQSHNVESLGDWEWAWHRLLGRIHPYLAFVRYGTDWQEHVDDLRATSPENLVPYVPKQQLIADNLLGAIYIQVLQVVLEQQLVRTCAGQGCNRLFVPSRSGQIYCTSSCATSERVRKHRRKMQAAKG